jgi:signal transduction histidine kinase
VSNRVSNEDILEYTSLNSGQLYSLRRPPAAQWPCAESCERPIVDPRVKVIDRAEYAGAPSIHGEPSGEAVLPSGKDVGIATGPDPFATNPLPARLVSLIGAATACISTIILVGILAAMIGAIPPLAVLPCVILLYLLCCVSVPLAGHFAKRSAARASCGMMDELPRQSRAPESRDITATLAHELNQPLTAVSHYIEGCRALLAKGTGPENRKLDRALACASSEAIRAARIVGHMRELEARDDTALAVEDLNDVVIRAVSLIDHGAEQGGAAIDVDLEDVGAVYADRIQIEQVLVNLIRNAIDALQNCPTRRIIVKTRRCGEEAKVIVEDSGGGVPPELANRLFKPIESSKDHGMGLGLSICRAIVEAHGGAIWAGEAARGGAAFGFSVPCCSEDAYSAV